MAKQRLAFPFQFLVRSRSCSSPFPISQQPSPASPRPHPPRRAAFTSTAISRTPEAATQRYGTANEPPPHLSDGAKKKTSTASSSATSAAATPAKPERQRRLSPPEQQSGAASASNKKDADSPETTKKQGNTASREKETPEDGAQTAQDQSGGAANTTDRASTAAEAPKEDLSYASSQSALNTIMSMELPMSDQSADDKPPHLQAPRHIHHFDTFTIVRDLQEGGFSEEEAVNIMKAVRAVLADNMDLAREGIVGKADGEMAAYLFRAACSELRSEIRNNRSVLTERMRSERTSLQHEVDILSQRITADSASLKDELKGMFDDRKMSTRMERRDIENKIQELNYTITARLNSEMRSEVEGLRWVLVRRTAMALLAVAVTALLTLRIAKTGEKRKESAEAATAEKASGQSANGGSAGNKGELLPDKTLAASENPELVSLG